MGREGGAAAGTGGQEDHYGHLFRGDPEKPGGHWEVSGNWQAAIGSKPAGTLEREDKSGQLAINEAAAKVAGFSLGQTLYLVNNLPYAMRLEYGYSKQAPAGMVRLTAQRAQAIADKVSAEIARMP